MSSAEETPPPRGAAAAAAAASASDPLEWLTRRASLPSPTSAFHAGLVGCGLLRAGDRLVQTVRLESAHPDRQRFLCVVSSKDKDSAGGGSSARKRSTISGGTVPNLTSSDGDSGGGAREDFCLIGIDRFPRPGSSSTKGELETTVGLVARLTWNVHVSLDGDGGFSLRQPGRHLIFKPASVQALWTVIQALHMIVGRLSPTPDSSTSSSSVQAGFGDGHKRHSERSLSISEWDLSYPVTSPQSCINEWHAMADLLVKRPPSPDRLSWGEAADKGAERESPEVVIKSLLRKIMKSADLDSITSKSIRAQLESDVGESLEKFKSFIDKEILVILGQMDPASKITDYLYLGSEWNASNLEELQQNGITHILNVTREIDNFFPAVFTYKNVREYDEEATELLKYLDRTYRFIRGAKETGGKVLVHCKMGISRSATVTISFVMKEYGLSLQDSLKMVRGKRGIVKPNKSFLKQLEVYEGILGAIRHRHTYLGGLFRSKSESSLVPSPVLNEGESPEDVDFDDVEEADGGGADRGRSPLSSPPVKVRVDIKALATFFNRPNSEPVVSSQRPKSWSPSEEFSKFLFPEKEGRGSELFRRPRVDKKEQEEDCRCFEEMSQFGERKRSDVTAVEATNPNVSLPPAEAEARNPLVMNSGSSSMLQPVNSSLFNPDCECDMELELKVPDAPVTVVGGGDRGGDQSPDDKDTDDIVQSMSNVPLQVRTNSRLPDIIQKQMTTPAVSIVEQPPPQVSASSEPSSPAVVTAPLPPPPPESPLIRTEEEELSVKTLASMFDYKIGSVPYRTCSAKLEESKLFQKAKRLADEVVANQDESNC